MQSLKAPKISNQLYPKLTKLGFSIETIDALVEEYRKEFLKDPKSLGDILEVLE